MIKKFNEVEVQGNVFNLIMSTYRKPTAYTILNNGRLNTFPHHQEEGKHILSHHYYLILYLKALSRIVRQIKKNINELIWKERSKTISVLERQNLVSRKS